MNPAGQDGIQPASATIPATIPTAAPAITPTAERPNKLPNIAPRMPSQKARVNFVSRPTRTIRKSLDEHAETRRKSHRQNHHNHCREKRRAQLFLDDSAVGDVIAHERAEHVDIAVGKVDQAEDAVNHRVAEGDQRVGAALRDAIDELLKKSDHRRP